jgi:uncharacterized protein YkwD
MGVEDRDWYRDEPKPLRTIRVGRLGGALIVVGVIVGLVLAGALQAMTKGSAATYGGEQYNHQGAAKISLLPGLPAISIGGDALYANADPWKRYLADERTCPGGEKLNAPLAEQANTMVCLVNYARRKRGLQPVATVDVLNRSALAKANRIVRCLDFNHDACGEAPEADIRALGYNGAWGENLFISNGPYGAPRPALDGWLNSPGHRKNLFRPEWRMQGIAVEKVAKFGQDQNMALWVNQFGDG